MLPSCQALKHLCGHCCKSALLEQVPSACHFVGLRDASRTAQMVVWADHL